MVQTTGETSKSTSVEIPKNLHLVYSVNNIQGKVKVLDGVKVTYGAWVKLFRLHVKGFDALNHIDGTAALDPSDDEYATWIKIDAVVVQWIYHSLSDELLDRVLDDDSTARETWIKLQNIFLNNKRSRAAALQHSFSNLTLTACTSMDDYCQRLKSLAEQLKDVDQPVTDERLVIQLVNGLPPEFDTVAAFINQSDCTWDDARNKIQLEIDRQAARQKTTSSVLTTSKTNPNQPPAPPSSHYAPQQQ